MTSLCILDRRAFILLQRLIEHVQHDHFLGLTMLVFLWILSALILSFLPTYVLDQYYPISAFSWYELVSVQLFFTLITCLFVLWFFKQTRLAARSPNKTVVAFFHPFCECGGGGERVLWQSVELLLSEQATHPVTVIIISGATQKNTEILASVTKNFGIFLEDEENLVIYRTLGREVLDGKAHPRFTLLMQSWASIKYAFKALYYDLPVTPDVFIDSTGFAFTLPIAKILFGCKTSAYVRPVMSPSSSSNIFLKKKLSKSILVQETSSLCFVLFCLFV